MNEKMKKYIEERIKTLEELQERISNVDKDLSTVYFHRIQELKIVLSLDDRKIFEGGQENE